MNAERNIELTTSAWWGNTEETFHIASEVDKLFPDNSKLRLEVYPVAHRLPMNEKIAMRLPIFRTIVHDGNGFAFRDGRVSVEKLKEWQLQYDVQVERVHLPFHYSIPSASYNYIVQSTVDEPGTLKDRFIATAVGMMTMTAMNNFAQKLVGEFEGAGLNSHRNIVEEAKKRNKLAKIKGKAAYLWIENDLDYPRKEPDDIKNEGDPGKVIDLIEDDPENLDGLIYGVDHAFRAGVDPKEDFNTYRDQFKKHLRTLHLSGSRRDHGLIENDDHAFWDFMHFVREKISDDVRFCLDLNPAEMDRKTPSEQVDYFRNLVKKLRRI